MGNLDQKVAHSVRAVQGRPLTEPMLLTPHHVLRRAQYKHRNQVNLGA